MKYLERSFMTDQYFSLFRFTIFKHRFNLLKTSRLSNLNLQMRTVFLLVVQLQNISNVTWWSFIRLILCSLISLMTYSIFCKISQYSFYFHTLISIQMQLIWKVKLRNYFIVTTDIQCFCYLSIDLWILHSGILLLPLLYTF